MSVIAAEAPRPTVVATVVAAVAVPIIAVPVVTAVAEISPIDDIPEATAEVISVSADLTEPAAAGGTGEKRGRKRGTTVPRWTPEEEDRLRALIEELGEKDWLSVAGRLETGRSPAGVEQHWQIMSGKRKRNGAKEDGEAGAVEAGAGESTP